MKITDDLHGFLWSDSRANNANTYLVHGKKNILIDPGHGHLFEHVSSRLEALALKPGDMDLIVKANFENVENMWFGYL